MPTPDYPVLEAVPRLLQALASSSCAVLSAPTGSGKTTQVPPELLARGAVRGRIVVLQPRRLAARAVARRVSSERGWNLGGEVGFQTRFERVCGRDTRLLFSTDGLFLRQLLAPRALEGVGAVVLDEIHERSLAMDLVAGIVRREQRAGSPVRLLAMSATLDSESLGRSLGAPVIASEGRLHPVEVSWAGDAPGDPAQRAARALADAIAGGAAGDALVFLPGKGEIARCGEACVQALARLGERAEVLPLHGSLSPQEQDRVLAPSTRRKVVLATNIAQTSVTIDGIRLVIDTGMARVPRFDPIRDLNALGLEPISQASAAQRTGRAGRTAPGVCVRLWSEASHARRDPFDLPEIARSELSEALLLLLAAGMKETGEFPFLDPPPPRALEHAWEVLGLLGAVDSGRAITARGREMARMPAHPRLARAMQEAARLGCVGRTARWCGILSVGDIMRQGQTPLDELEAGEEPCDLLCRERMLSRGMRAPGMDPALAQQALTAAEDLARIADRGGAAPAGGDGDPARCLLAAFPDRVAWRSDRNRPTAAMPGRRKVEIDRRSAVRREGPLLALEVRQSGDGSVSTLSMLVPLERRWVEEAQPDAFEVVVEERWDPSARCVVEAEEVRYRGVPLERTERPPRDLARAAQELAARVASGDIVLAKWDDAVEQYLARVRSAAAWHPERPLPSFDESDLAVIRLELCTGRTRAKEVEQADCLAAVKGALSAEDRRFVDRVAPESLALPSGRRARLRYAAGSPPRVRTRIQDLYGLSATPSVDGGRMRVLLEITGPNDRPLQVTQDLAAFWTGLYPGLRNELKRRYPRHDWRERPQG